MSRAYSQDERHLVAAHRALLEYVAERVRPDLTLDEARPAETFAIEICSDGSGRLTVDTDDPGPRFTAAGWNSIEEASEKIASATQRLLDERADRAGGRRIGDPRKGRRQVDEDCDGEAADV